MRVLELEISSLIGHRFSADPLGAASFCVMTDESLTPARAIRLLRAKAAELEAQVQYADVRGVDDLQALVADVALVATLLADHMESVNATLAVYVAHSENLIERVYLLEEGRPLPQKAHQKAWYQYPSDDFILIPVEPQEGDVLEVRKAVGKGKSYHATWRSWPHHPMCGLGYEMEPDPVSVEVNCTYCTKIVAKMRREGR